MTTFLKWAFLAVLSCVFMTFGRILDMDNFDMFDGNTETGLISELFRGFCLRKVDRIEIKSMVN